MGEELAAGGREGQPELGKPPVSLACTSHLHTQDRRPMVGSPPPAPYSLLSVVACRSFYCSPISGCDAFAAVLSLDCKAKGAAEPKTTWQSIGYNGRIQESDNCMGFIRLVPTTVKYPQSRFLGSGIMVFACLRPSRRSLVWLRVKSWQSPSR